VHSFIERKNYHGPFLPGFVAVTKRDPISDAFKSPGLLFIDHVVGNQPDRTMDDVVQWYEKTLDFHRFWSVDDKQIHT
jgi:4-hydroxyphenylpyruvate dioxygenase